VEHVQQPDREDQHLDPVVNVNVNLPSVGQMVGDLLTRAGQRSSDAAQPLVDLKDKYVTLFKAGDTTSVIVAMRVNTVANSAPAVARAS
jgi:hypothetical protein